MQYRQINVVEFSFGENGCAALEPHNFVASIRQMQIAHGFSAAGNSYMHGELMSTRPDRLHGKHDTKKFPSCATQGCAARSDPH